MTNSRKRPAHLGRRQAERGAPDRLRADADARFAIRQPGDRGRDEVGVVVAQREAGEAHVHDQPPGAEEHQPRRVRAAPRSTATATLTGPLRSRPESKRQIGLAADGRQVGLAPSFRAGAAPACVTAQAGRRGVSQRRDLARARPVRQPPAEARRQRVRPVASRPGRPDRRPLDVAGARRIDDQVVAERARRSAAASASRPTCAKARAVAPRTPGPSITSSRPPPSTNVSQRRDLGRRERLRRLGDDQHAAAGRRRVADARRARAPRRRRAAAPRRTCA